MRDLFKAEFLRFRTWAIVFAVVHLLVLGFMTRVVDLAQQPDLVYQVIGGVYVLTGLLLGMYQMGGYRRPNAWLNLLHRPLPHWQVAAALFAAGAVLLTIAIALPTLTIAIWQKTMTARVLDTRHLWLLLSALLIAWCGYLAGGYAMLGHKRYGASALVFLALLMASNAVGLGAIVLQLLVLAWLAIMIVSAFKPDLSSPPQNVVGIVATALPLQMAGWMLFMLICFGAELVWIMQGTHPNNLPTPIPGSAKEADNAEPKDLIIAGLRNSRAADAPLWREQAAISDVFQMATNVRWNPVRNELTNKDPMEFDDDTRRIRWVFSHDSMRFEGYSLADFRAVGRLGVDGDGAFPTPPVIGPMDSLISRDTVFQYDSDAKLVLPRLRVPAGETITSIETFDERILLMSDRALYFYDIRELHNGDGVLTPRAHVPVPGKTGNLERVDVMELLDGYLVSFVYSRYSHNGDGPAFQEVLRVDEHDRTVSVGRRELGIGYGPVFRYSNWYISPVLFKVQKFAVNLFAGYVPVRDFQRPPVLPAAVGIAVGMALLSLIGGAWRLRRVAVSMPARLAWLVACFAIGPPALFSLWLLYPERERLDDLPIASAATA